MPFQSGGKVLLLLLLMSLCYVGSSLAQQSGLTIHPEVTVDAGYRMDQIDWSIAGTRAGTAPNILSELTWDDLEIYQFRMHGSIDLVSDKAGRFNPHMRGLIGYGFIQDGTVQDSDYLGDNRTLEFSRSNNAADQGNVLDLSLGFGPKISLWEGRLTLIPLVGYSYHEQNLKLLDGYQTIPAKGAFAGLDSSYDTQWYGPWLGIEFEFIPSSRLLFRGLTEYHQVDYYAEANWNLRTAFAHPKSFEHYADGSGWINELGVDFLLNKNWSLALSGTYQIWETDPGHERLFLADGSTYATRLNQVNWESASLQLGLTYRF